MGWISVLPCGRHNGRDGVSNYQPHDCLLNHLFRRRSKKTSKLRVAGLCAGNSSGTGEFPAQMASNAENVSIWWRHHGIDYVRYIDDLVQKSSNSSAVATELLQSCTKPSICSLSVWVSHTNATETQLQYVSNGVISLSHETIDIKYTFSHKSSVRRRQVRCHGQTHYYPQQLAQSGAHTSDGAFFYI